MIEIGGGRAGFKEREEKNPTVASLSRVSKTARTPRKFTVF